MRQEDIKQEMYEIKSKMRTIEWDRERNLALSNKHIYEQLKIDYEKLEKKLKDKK